MPATAPRTAQRPKSPAPERTGGSIHTLPVRERVSAEPGSLLLQRCPGCACGGRCPRCQARVQSATLRINTPGDAHEQEAERVAEAVVSGGGATPRARGGGAVPQLQRSACGGSCSACQAEEETTLQRSGEGAAPAVAPALVHQVLASPGRPLEATTRSFMEARFGADFAGVRVHTDRRAAESARSVGARAYTVGQKVVFGAGQYAPGTAAGRHLLAHELTHVLQQGTRGMLALQRHSCREGEGPPAAEPPIAGETGPHPLVYRGVSSHRSRRPAVGDAQELLNRFLDLLSQGKAPCKDGADLVVINQLRSTLSEDPLVVDCRFGPNTETAAKMFQRCVFPGQPTEWDGKIGSKTWAELVKLRSSPTPTPMPTPMPTPPAVEDCSVLLGDCEFYLCRDRKNPCGPGGYYRGYGHKYCIRFSTVTRPRMTTVGQEWIDCTLRCLQVHVDSRIPENADCATVKASAYASHSDCYVGCGVCWLPPGDVTRLQDTIDPEDLDRLQFWETVLRCATLPKPPATRGFQTECVIRLGGCVETISAGPEVTDEEIRQYNEECRRKLGYTGPDVRPTPEDCARYFGR